MGNCATNCSNCMGKDGIEHNEVNMDVSKKPSLDLINRDKSI